MKNRSIPFILAAVALYPLTALPQNQPASSVPNILDSKAFDSSFGKLPTNITSDSLTFNAKERIFAYMGNVQVTQGDMRLTSKTLEGTYSEKNELQKLVAKGDVIITKQDIQATGQVASYDAISSIVILTENPQLQQKESILRADKIKIFLNENRSQAEGDVRVTFVNTKDGAPDLTAAANPVATAVPQPTPAVTAKVATTPTPIITTPTLTPKRTTKPKTKAKAQPTPKPTRKK